MPGGRDSPIKITGMLIGNLVKNPLKVPDSRLVGVAQINFHPSEVPGVLRDDKLQINIEETHIVAVIYCSIP